MGTAAAATTARATTETAVTHSPRDLASSTVSLGNRPLPPGKSLLRRWRRRRNGFLQPLLREEVMMIATKKPRVQTKMSNSVSETSQVTHPNPPPSSSSPCIHVMCERALTLFKAVIIKSPSIKPTPKNPPITPNCFQRCCVTRNDDENRDEVEEGGGFGWVT